MSFWSGVFYIRSNFRPIRFKKGIETVYGIEKGNST